MSKATTQISNFYAMLPKEYQSAGSIAYDNYENIKIKVPFRMLILGSSGSGKTNVALNLIKLIGVFTKIYLFAKNTEEPLYAYLIDTLTKLSIRMKKQLIVVSNDLDSMSDVDEIDKDENNLFIFDDLITTKNQRSISDLFIRGRKQNASVIYISQSYFDIPNLIRKNSDYIIIKKINTKRDLKSIMKEYNLNDVSEDQLMNMYKSVIAQSFTNFLLLDVNTNDPKLKFRCNFSPMS